MRCSRREGLQIGRRVRDARVEVKAGQIVGLAGLLGSGRTETARAIFGADPPDAGAIRVLGKDVTPREPSDAIALGVGYCSEDRKADGIIPDMSVRENITLAILPRLVKMGVVDEARQRAIVDKFMKRLAIKASSAEQKIRELSGGNQQKVLLARWLCTDPKLLILDEPTRGIDVGAKAEIQSLIRELADQGLGVLMISSELEEIIEGADRVFVLSDGRTVADLPHAAANASAIMAAMAHGGADGDGASRPWLTRRRSRERRIPFDARGVLPALCRAGGPHRAAAVQLRGDAAFRQPADAEREPHSGRDDRHRLGRHDPGHRDRRHRPVGRFADGDIRRARAADLPQSVRPRACRARQPARLRRPDRGRGSARRCSTAGSSPDSRSSRSSARSSCSSPAAASGR